MTQPIEKTRADDTRDLAILEALSSDDPRTSNPVSIAKRLNVSVAYVMDRKRELEGWD